MIKDSRFEKKFIFVKGDFQYKLFLLKEMFFKKFPDRMVNSIYLDDVSHKDVWDNINGYGYRKKIRFRWYDYINNSPIFLEEKKKINLLTKKNTKKIGYFQNYKQFNLYLNSENYMNEEIILNYKKNLIRTVFVQYDREYFFNHNDKIRITIDNNIKVYLDYPERFYNTDKTILELKYSLDNSDYINRFVYNSNFLRRNEKFSKYVNSFNELYDNGFI